MACGKRFAYVDVLSNPEIRSSLPKVSNWPTFPQLYINGELVGGCDIITEMHEKGELQTLVDSAETETETETETKQSEE
jgi:monothiol glutaredoxin